MNQRIADFLLDIPKELLTSNPHLPVAISRAVKSLRECRTDLTCVEDLGKLKGIGPYITSLIVARGKFFSNNNSSTSTQQQTWNLNDWIESIGLARFKPQFVDLGFDTILSIKAIGDAELDLLGVIAPGHRLAFKSAIAALNNNNNNIAHPPPPPPPIQSSPPRQRAPPVVASQSAPKVSRKRASTGAGGDAKRAYTPLRHSGGWAVLIVLHLNLLKAARAPNDMTPLPMPIDECRRDAQLWARTSMVKDGVHNYNAWSSLKTLKDKFLVTVSNKRIALTPTGVETAKTIFEQYALQQQLEGKQPTDPPFGVSSEPAAEPTPMAPPPSNFPPRREWLDLASNPHSDENDNDYDDDNNDDDHDDEVVLPERRPVVAVTAAASVATERFAKRGRMHGTSGEIVLIVDSRERPLLRGDAFSEHLEQQLRVHRIAWESRVLGVGDFAWLLRAPSDASGGGVVEHMLHVLVERKSMSDLVSSLSDGRFEEQQHRIIRSGIAVSFFLIEGTEQDVASSGLGAAGLLRIAADLAARTSLKVHRTSDMHETVKFLQLVTARLVADLRAGRLESTERRFEEFQNELKKRAGSQLSHILASQLYQVNGVSTAAAEALARHFGTCAELVRTLCGLPRERRVAKLAEVAVENDGNVQACKLGTRAAACIENMLFGGASDVAPADSSVD
jgi:ERCC4-type nuclease